VQYNRSSINRDRSATIARQDEALRLRNGGMSYIDIARQLGFTPNGVPRPQSAAEAVRAAKRRLESNGGVPENEGVRPEGFSEIPSQRTFGVEAEFFGISPTVAVGALRNVGIDVEFRGYTHEVTSAWKIVTDASVTKRGTGVRSGLELVSPVLQGVEGLEKMATAIKALMDAGASVDRTCGIHVHVGMDNLTGYDLMKVIDFYIANQKSINTLVASSRHSNQYCAPYTQQAIRTEDHTWGLIRRMTDVEQTKQQKNVFNTGSRYRVINIQSYSKYGTLEFRQHQGTLSPEKLTSWIQFILAMVEKAVTLDDARTELGNLSSLLDSLDIKPTVKQYLTNRAERLASTRN